MNALEKVWAYIPGIKTEDLPVLLDVLETDDAAHGLVVVGLSGGVYQRSVCQ